MKNNKKLRHIQERSIKKGLESFKSASSGQKGEYNSDFEERIRIIENYKNIRDLK
jgi:hypothetical protein